MVRPRLEMSFNAAKIISEDVLSNPDQKIKKRQQEQNVANVVKL